MKITLAKTAGFCFGVDRAVNSVYDLINDKEKVCTLGPIIHNQQLVAELQGQGVRIVESGDDVADDETLVIRSHGVPENVIKSLDERGIKYADATCPFVSKIHKIVKEASNKGDIILIAGDKHHHEVMGIVGHASGKIFVFGDQNELDELLKNNPEITTDAVTVVSQDRKSVV